MDLEISLFLNQFIGKSVIFDRGIYALAEYLPWMLGIAALVWLFRTFRENRFRLILVGATLFSIWVSRTDVVEGIRFLYHRSRPFLASPLIHPLFLVHEWSFPSGHAITLATLAAAIFYWDKKSGIFFLGGAAIVSLARVCAGVHYLSDVTAGMVFGFCVGYFAMKLIELHGLVERKT
jgi:membrane-associated phospholipid phosphatase